MGELIGKRLLQVRLNVAQQRVDRFAFGPDRRIDGDAQSRQWNRRPTDRRLLHLRRTRPARRTTEPARQPASPENSAGAGRSKAADDLDTGDIAAADDPGHSARRWAVRATVSTAIPDPIPRPARIGSPYRPETTGPRSRQRPLVASDWVTARSNRHSDAWRVEWCCRRHARARRPVERRAVSQRARRPAPRARPDSPETAHPAGGGA